MHPEIQSLSEHLREAIAILERHGLEHWASWLRTDEARIRELDLYGLEHLLSAFGGMGSLNDLRLARPDTESPEHLSASPEDARFQMLAAEIHRLATKLAREE
jgi:hypothetical protein